MKQICILLIVYLTFGLFACEESGLNMHIRFDQVMGLKVDDRVIFESNSIGQVTRVFYTQAGDYLVDIIIQEDFAHAATENARFYIIKDPQTADNKAIEMIQIRQGGAPLADGSTVEGATRSSAVFQKMFENFDQQTGKLGKQFEKLWNS